MLKEENNSPALETLSNLNPPQQEAVNHFLGPILVLAGAGSGKTRVLTHRIVNLVLKHKVFPQEILAVTFTNKATDEMRARLKGLLGDKASQLWVATFHSSALRILRRHAKHLGYSNDFAVYDDQDSKSTLKEVIKSLDLDEKKFPASVASRYIDQAKNAFVSPVQFLLSDEIAIAKDFEKQVYSEIYSKYQESLLKSNAMDFGDLLVNAVLLLQNHEEVRKLYQHHLRFILVDEFQDTNKVQYLFIKILSELHKNLLVVGDDDQSIYAFRGATISNILEFEKDYANTKVIKLEQNYRSSANILKAAHAVIEKNKSRKDKKLWTDGDAGESIKVNVSWDEIEEADYVAREIVRLKKEGYAYDQMAIFYRTNAQSRALEEALVGYEIPYRIYGGLKFYDRKEIKDIISYLRLIANDFDSQAFLRIVNTPARGIGPQTVRNIAEYSRQAGISLFSAAGELRKGNKSLTRFIELIDKLRSEARRSSLSELIKHVIQLSEYGPSLKASKDPTAQSRIENLKEFESLARSFEKQEMENHELLRAFLDRVSLSSSSELPVEENQDVTKNAGADIAKPEVVSLMTLHLAKGLEFPVVFLTGLEEGLLPHYKSMDLMEQIEEERRLCYVGITRAMKILHLTRARSRGMFSSGEGFGSSGFYRELSRFAYDIPKDVLEEKGNTLFSDGTSLDREDEEFLSEMDEFEDIAPEVRTSFMKPKKPKKDKTKKSFMICSADDLEDN